MKLCVALIAAVFPAVQSARRTVAPLAESLRSEIGALTNAVEQGDLQSVARIFSLLNEEAKKRSPNGNATEGHALLARVGQQSPAKSSLSLKMPSQVSVHTQKPDLRQNVQSNLLKAHVAEAKQPGACVLDDVIFSMTPEAKLELYKELDDPVMKEAFNWVRTGGWWHCAMYGEQCTCHGSVRLVSADYTAESLPVDLTAQGNVMKCDIANFGGVDVKPGQAKVCECSHPLKNGVDQFHLHKRLTSKSYLQEVWIFLLRLLGRAKLLPAGTGDRLYHGMQNWAARHNPANIPMVLERVWIQMFVEEVALQLGEVSMAARAAAGTWLHTQCWL